MALAQKKKYISYNVADMRSPDEGLPAGLTEPLGWQTKGGTEAGFGPSKAPCARREPAYPELSDVARASRY